MKKIINTYLMIIFILLNQNCTRLEEEDDSPILYYNSFENEEDLQDWGISPIFLRDDPCPNGGEKSIYISGGCVIPHSSRQFDPPKKDLIISVEFYGKALVGSGAFSILIENDFLNGYHISVRDTFWKKYISEEIYWPSDSTMSIWLGAGGIVSASMLIDEIIVTKIN